MLADVLGTVQSKKVMLIPVTIDLSYHSHYSQLCDSLPLGEVQKPFVNSAQGQSPLIL